MSETESFEQAMTKMTGKVASTYWIGMVERLKRAYDRAIRDTAQQQYSRGYHDGQHSMDAEHRAVAMRLRHLPLDGGSHENLSQIARAVYHSDFGWTQGACAALRDELVRLMGGVSDGTAEPMTTDEFIEFINQDTRRLKGDASKAGDGDDACGSQCCGACADSDGRDSGEQVEVNDGGTADDCGADSRGGDGGGDLHMDRVRITDELREFVGTFSKRLSISVAEVNAIADRIDEQFDRICWQQDAVLQETIDGMVDERDSDQQRIEKLVKQRDAARARTDELSDELLRTRRERDELQEKCAELSAELSHQRRRTELACGAVYSAERERDELRKRLDAITAALNG